MTSTYIAIEHRIKKAINALNTRQNPSQTEIARGFDVPLQRLRSRLAGGSWSGLTSALHICDETLTKIEFLAAFNGFRSKAFKETTICSAWKKNGLIPFDPNVVLNKVRETRPSARPVTSFTVTESPDIWKITFTTRKQLKRQQVSYFASAMNPSFIRS